MHWKEGIPVPIFKKDNGLTDSNSYRPISLLRCTAKLLEHMINTRLVWHIKENGYLIPQQSSFRRHRSTEDQVAYIDQEIEDAFQEKKHVLAIWVNLEKTFDKIWKSGLKIRLRRN
jgi:hypothetical protein